MARQFGISFVHQAVATQIQTTLYTNQSRISLAGRHPRCDIKDAIYILYMFDVTGMHDYCG